MRRSYGRKDQQQKNWPVFSRSTPNQLLICSSFGKESRTNQGYFQGPPIMGHLPLSVPLLGVLENPTEQSIKMSDSPTELRRFFTILQRLQAPPKNTFWAKISGRCLFLGAMNRKFKKSKGGLYQSYISDQKVVYVWYLSVKSSYSNLS